MPAHSPRLLLLPGLGADASMFAAQRLAFPQLETPPWAPLRRTDTLAQFAHRMAQSIDPTPPLYIGGVSFGGMVALEMSRRLAPAAIFLIASCRSGTQVSASLRRGIELTRGWPDKWFEPLRRLSRWLIDGMRGLSAGQRRALRGIAKDTDVAFVRWGLSAIARWHFDGPPVAPVHHIHGDRDALIPIRNVRPDRIMRGGGHLINMTHWRPVNTFLRTRMRDA